MSETDQKKKPTKPEKLKEGTGKDLSPSSPLPTEPKIKPPQQRVEIVDTSKPQETTKTDVKIYKYTKCPYEDCEAEQICYDPKLNVYFCGSCGRFWR